MGGSYSVLVRGRRKNSFYFYYPPLELKYIVTQALKELELFDV
jgi:hypothetical protein